MSKSKLYLLTIMTTIFILLFSQNSFSAPYVKLKLTYDGKTINYNNEKVYLQINSTPVENLPLEPIILNNYTLVPAREVFEKLGANVTWLKESSQVQVVYKEKVVIMKINDLNATVNGTLLNMNIPPKLINSKTMIPVRFVSESVGLLVNWDAKTRIINIVEQPVEDTTTETTTITTIPETAPIQTSNIITLQSIDMPDSDQRTFSINANEKIEKFEQKILEDGSVAIDIFNSIFSIPQTNLDSVSEFVSNVQIESIGNNTTRFVFKTKSSVLNNNFLSKDGKTLYANFGGNPIKKIETFNDGTNDILTIFGDFPPVAKVLRNEENNNLTISIENASLMNPSQNIKDTSFIKSLNTQGSTNTNVTINLELNEKVNFSTKEDTNSISFAFFKDDNLNNNIPEHNNNNSNNSNNNNNNNNNNSNNNITSNRQFKIPKNSNIPININAIKHTDNYLNKQYILTFDTDITPMLNLGVHYVNNDLVNTITVENIGSNTQLILDCKKITAINVTEDNENIYINMLLPKEKYKFVVVVDPGHGGSAPGTAGNGLVEKDINLKIALKLNALFEANPDIKAYFTRLEDVNPSFDDRTNMSNEVGDIFVSIHQNAATNNSNPNGTEVYYLKPNTLPSGLTSKDLAATFQKHLLKDLGLLDRKIKTNNYIVLRNNKIPAILCEVGFLSNPSDASKLGTDEFQQKAAQSLYNATLEIFEKYPTNR